MHRNARPAPSSCMLSPCGDSPSVITSAEVVSFGRWCKVSAIRPPDESVPLTEMPSPLLRDTKLWYAASDQGPTGRGRQQEQTDSQTVATAVARSLSGAPVRASSRDAQTAAVHPKANAATRTRRCGSWRVRPKIVACALKHLDHRGVGYAGHAERLDPCVRPGRRPSGAASWSRHPGAFLQRSWPGWGPSRG